MLMKLLWTVLNGKTETSITSSKSSHIFHLFCYKWHPIHASWKLKKKLSRNYFRVSPILCNLTLAEVTPVTGVIWVTVYNYVARRSLSNSPDPGPALIRSPVCCGSVRARPRLDCVRNVLAPLALLHAPSRYQGRRCWTQGPDSSSPH